jgi:hypothetical protein
MITLTVITLNYVHSNYIIMTSFDEILFLFHFVKLQMEHNALIIMKFQF